MLMLGKPPPAGNQLKFEPGPALSVVAAPLHIAVEGLTPSTGVTTFTERLFDASQPPFPYAVNVYTVFTVGLTEMVLVVGPFDHITLVPPEAESRTELPLQVSVELRLLLTTGAAVTMITVLVPVVQFTEFVPETWYSEEVVGFTTAMLPVIVEGIQVYVSAPVTVIVADLPSHSVALLREMDSVGFGFVFTATVPVPVHMPSEAVTVYTVEVSGAARSVGVVPPCDQV
jgi:hypothetical protein